eukprot:g3313.t1
MRSRLRRGSRPKDSREENEDSPTTTTIGKSNTDDINGEEININDVRDDGNGLSSNSPSSTIRRASLPSAAEVTTSPSLHRVSISRNEHGQLTEEGFVEILYRPFSFSALTFFLFFWFIYIAYIQQYSNEIQQGSFLVSFFSSSYSPAPQNLVNQTLWDPSNRVADDIAKAQQKMKEGITFALLFLITYSLVQSRDGYFSRPHPVIWRLVRSIALAYCLLLTAASVHNVSDVRRFVRIFDPSVPNRPLVKSYGDDCRIRLNTLWGSFYDRFTLAHALGWFVKALMFRDFYVLTIISIGFEVIESSLQHVLPNFNECWWDHLLLDVFGANLVGMIIGLALLKQSQIKSYTWMGQPFKAIKTVTGKLIRVAAQLLPFGPPSDYPWRGSPSRKIRKGGRCRTRHSSSVGGLRDPFTGSRKTLVFFCICLFDLIGTLNGFLLKVCLWIPIEHSFHPFRLCLMTCLCMEGAYEMNLLSEKRTDRLGQNSFLIITITLLECGMFVKFLIFEREKLLLGLDVKSLYPAPYIVFLWSAAVFSIIIWLFGALVLDWRTPKKSFLIRIFMKFSFHMMYLPFVALLLIDCFRTFAYHPPPKPGIGLW